MVPFLLVISMENNIKSIELNRLVIVDTFISFNSTNLHSMSFVHGLKLPLLISIQRS